MNLIDENKERIDSLLVARLPKPESTYHRRVVDALSYSFSIGGKRLRPLLMESSFNAVGGREENVEILSGFMAAMEMIHTYSLIHDDLPAMDDDDLRRGKPTCHKAYDEATAVLAGDALLNYAFELVAELMAGFGEMKPEMTQAMIEANHQLTRCAGIYGMIGGQAADMKFENEEMDSMDALTYIYSHKTGALITASLVIGGLIGEADRNEIRLLEQMGHHIGMAFQIQDDLLDIFSTEEVLGKPIGSDSKNNKKTYVAFVGVEQSQKDVITHLSAAEDILGQLHGDRKQLKGILQFLKDRKY